MPAVERTVCNLHCIAVCVNSLHMTSYSSADAEMARKCWRPRRVLRRTFVNLNPSVGMIRSDAILDLSTGGRSRRCQTSRPFNQLSRPRTADVQQHLGILSKYTYCEISFAHWINPIPTISKESIVDGRVDHGEGVVLGPIIRSSIRSYSVLGPTSMAALALLEPN